MVNSDLELLVKANRYLSPATWDPEFIGEKAEGSRIWLNGRPYLDFVTGPGVANVGWNRPEVLEAVLNVYRNNESGCGGNMLVNKYQVALAEKLCELTPGKFPKKVFFSNSGGGAVEAAILACMKTRPERRGMVSFIGGFHGRLGFGRTATTSRQMHFEKMPWGIEKPFFLVFPALNPETVVKKRFLEKLDIHENYLSYVENQIGPFINEINFALFELVQGEGGINVAAPGPIHKLVKYLQDHKVFVIIDEVQSGLGRTGRMWAADYYGIKPDIMTIAKALSGGAVPIGATVMREDIAYKHYGEHSNTFGGNAQACAAGLAVLDILCKEKLAERAREKRSILWEALEYRDFSGAGMMNRLTFTYPPAQKRAIAEARKLGLFLTGAGEQSVRLMPPLNISDAELREATDILLKIL